MITRIVVWSRKEIEENPTDKFSHIISIIDPKKPLHVEGRNVTQHIFHDIEQPMAEATLPTKQNVQEIIDHLKEGHALEEEVGFLIHCTAGISRSTAAALIGFYLVHGDEKKAFANLLHTRRSCWPNLLMLRFADEILGSNLLKIVGQWKYDVRTHGEQKANYKIFN